MSDVYALTNNIQVFPSTRRNTTQRSARLLTEANLISIINQIVDSDAFVISQSYDGADPLEFNIHGYYFKVSNPSAIEISGATNIWAIIELTETPITPEGDIFVELDGQDENGEYTGVRFSNTAPSGGSDNVYSLKVLSRSSSSDAWSIPQESKVMFTNPRNIFGELVVDGGTIS